MARQARSQATVVSRCCAATGIVGSLACSISMTLAALGLTGAAVSAGANMAGMQGMSGGGDAGPGSQSPVVGVVDFLVHAGPIILLISIVAIVLAFGIRRRAAVIPALGAGGLMYWGMYLQPRLGLMYAAIVLGLLGWAALYFWTRGWQFPLLRRW